MKKVMMTRHSSCPVWLSTMKYRLCILTNMLRNQCYILFYYITINDMALFSVYFLFNPAGCPIPSCFWLNCMDETQNLHLRLLYSHSDLDTPETPEGQRRVAGPVA